LRRWIGSSDRRANSTPIAASPRRLDAVRVAGAGRSAGRSRGETFPACKSLKSLKMESEPADGSVCDTAALRALRLRTFSRPGHSNIRATGRSTKTVRGMSSTPLIELAVELDRYLWVRAGAAPRRPNRHRRRGSRLPRTRLGGTRRAGAGETFLPAKA
jgi:hypothetical protein